LWIPKPRRIIVSLRSYYPEGEWTGPGSVLSVILWDSPFLPNDIMNKFFKPLLPSLIATAVIGVIWLFKGATDQELLANAAKAVDFHPWSGWWSPSFLGGASQAPGLTTLLTYLFLKPFLALFGTILGAKLAILIAVFLGGVGVSSLLREWTGSDTAAWMGSVAYILGPQMAQRVAGNEHLPVVFSMVFAPWILWGILRQNESPSWRNSTLLAVLGAGMALAFTKLAVVFAPVALLFVLVVWPSADGRGAFLKGLGRSFLIFLPLAVVVLLPTLREMQWLALFQFDPFAAWQQNFSLKSVLSWLDRSNLLQQGMPVGFVADQGGFYVGAVTLVVGLLAWRKAVAQERSEGVVDPLLLPLKAVFGMLLLVSWLSEGPRSIAQGMLEFLKNASGAPDLSIPLFWIMSVVQCMILWKIWPDHPRRNAARVAALLVYLVVPGFRLLELLPFAHDIRAPWSVWQVGGSLAVALLFGIGAALLCAPRDGAVKSSGMLPLVLVLLLAIDFAPYLARYVSGDLPPGTYPAFEQTCTALKQAPDTGGVYPLSGRYFYLQIPSLTGKPIEQEAFNGYFGLAWRRALQNASMAAPESMRAGLSLLGCSYIFIDKQDPNTPASLQQTMKSLFPALLENEYFVVLANQGTLYPAFLAHDYVALPQGSYAMAPAAVQLAPQNLITVEMAGVDRNAPGFAGMAKSANQIELLSQYQGKAGQPFARVPLAGNRNDDQRMTYQLPPTVSGWLIATQAYHPDWTVTIDGKPSEARRADSALLSTYVPQDSHEVTFEFKAPTWYSISLAFGLISWIAALVAILYLPSKYAPVQWRECWANGK